MKKILLILAIMVSFAASAQTLLTSTISFPSTYVNDTINHSLAVAAPGVWLINAAQNNPTTQDFTCKLDTIVGTNPTSVTVALYGRKSTLGAYAAIGSPVVWYLSTSDTIITISNATANRYRDYKVTYTLVGTGSVAGLKNEELKLYIE